MNAPLRDSYDVVVIGAGPAGASAASLLRGAGFDVAVFEKARFPRFVNRPWCDRSAEAVTQGTTPR